MTEGKKKKGQYKGYKENTEVGAKKLFFLKKGGWMQGNKCFIMKLVKLTS